MMTRLASKPTFVPHSVVWGAISSTLPIPTEMAKAILATRPAGMVLGSVSMKNRKIRTSGEITIIRQKSLPQTGPNAQSVVMQCPDPARIAGADGQRQPVRGGHRQQVQAARHEHPATDDQQIGERQPAVERAPIEVQRLDPLERRARRKATTRPTFDGLKTWEPRYWMTYLVSRARPATMANTYQSLVPQGSPAVVSVVRRISATPLPVSIALAGHTNMPVLRKRQRDLDDRAGHDGGQDLRHCHPEARAPTWPRTWIEMMTAATCRRGSRTLGSTTG